MIYKVEREIKLFLSCINNIDTDMCNMKNNGKQNNYKPIWISKYNFQSLLNIPAMMMNFGPLINYWEGSMQGEGYLRLVKPKINSIQNKNWHTNVHTKILNEFALDRMVDDYTNGITNNNNYQNYSLMKDRRKDRVKKMFHKYKCISEVNSTLNENQPISFVKMRSGKFKVIIHCGRKCDVTCLEMTVSHFQWLENFNMNCHEVKLNSTLTEQDLDDLNENDIVSYLIGLPLMINNQKTKHKNRYVYYFIDSEWNEINDK